MNEPGENNLTGPVSAGVVGRAEELARVRSFVAERDDGPTVLLLEGDAGMGKTSLWTAGLREAEACEQCLRVARPAEAEASFSYSTLVDLAGDVDETTLAALSPPRRTALESALLLNDGEASPDPFAVAAAFLELLRQAAVDSPVLVAVDDLQWVDAGSAAVLQYALRRTDGAAIRFLCTQRTDEAGTIDRSAANVETLALDSLSFGAIQHLLADRSQLELSRGLARRIHEASGGNPLFALELARAAKERGLERATELTLPPRLLDLLSDRLSRLTPASERAVLAVALGASLPLDRLAEVLGDASPIEDAIAASALAHDGGRVRLAHPLIGSAVLARAPGSARRGLSLRLAETSSDLEERARHLAGGSDAPSDDVALELARAARQARGRAAIDAAIELAHEAVRFAETDAVRGRILLDAAEYHADAGDFLGLAVAEEALEIFEGGSERARALSYVAQMKTNDSALPPVEEALALSSLDPRLRVRLLAQKVTVLTTGMVARVDEAEELGKRAVALATDLGDQDLLTLACVELSWPTALRGHEIEPLLEQTHSGGAGLFGEPDRLRGVRAMWRGEVDAARRYFTATLEQARERGEVWSEYIFLHHLLELGVRVGGSSSLERLVDEADLQASAMQFSRSGRLRARAFLAAWQGEVGSATSLLELVAEGGSKRWQRLEATRARGLAALLADDPEAAVSDLQEVAESVRAAAILEPGAFPASPDLIEALVLVGNLDAARRELEWLEGRAREQSHPWGLAVSARSRGLIAERDGDSEAAEESFREALDRHARLTLPLDEARTRLGLGMLVRRRGRRREARELLEQAASSFDELGVPPLAARAREELQQIGGRAPSADALTPAEARVARLVAEGMTNREVAQRLVVSVRAVEANLTRVYAKLGLRSRVELARTLGDDL